MNNLFDQCHQNNIVGAESNVDESSINFHKSKQLIPPKYFDLFSLPLELQDMIVGEMVHNCPPADWLHFAQTSKYSNWLVKRAKPKKIIDDLRIFFEEQSFCVEINKKYRKLSEAEVLKLLQTSQINVWFSLDDFFSEENKYWTPEFEKACFDSTRFLNELTIAFTRKSEVKCFNFYQNLQCLETLHVMKYVSNVSVLPRLPPALSIEHSHADFSQDDLLDFLMKLAQKTRDFPLSHFNSKIEFNLYDVQQFLQNGVFDRYSSFVFRVNSKKRESFEKMFMSLGARKLSSSEFRIPAPNSAQNVGEFSILLIFDSIVNLKTSIEMKKRLGI